jgi:hypothetical protein
MRAVYEDESATDAGYTANLFWPRIFNDGRRIGWQASMYNVLATEYSSISTASTLHVQVYLL